MIFDDFFKAIGQMNDRAFRRVLFLGLGLTIGLLVLLYWGYLALVAQFAGGTVALPYVGEITWLQSALGWGGLILMFVLSIFLMIPVASAITSFFLEDVADAVEAKHFPHLMPAPKQSFMDALKDTLIFFGVLIAANLLALIAYVVLPFFAIPIFYALNGFLLGREYFTLAATRREGRQRAKAMRTRHQSQIWMAGILMALPLTIPLMNLFIPILGAATFTHLYHRLAAKDAIAQR